MVAIFASATALLTPEFVGSFEPEILAAKFVQVEKETGVKFNKTNSTFNIVGHWDSIQTAHKSLRKLVLTLEKAPAPSRHDDNDLPPSEAQTVSWARGKENQPVDSKDAGACEKVIPIKGNPKRGRHTSTDPSTNSGLPEPVVYFQYQDKSYMNEEVLNLDALLDAFEDNLPDTIKVKKEDLKKILEKNTENMGRPLVKRKAYIQAQAELKAKQEAELKAKATENQQLLQPQSQLQGQGEGHVQGQQVQGYQGQLHIPVTHIQSEQVHPAESHSYTGHTQHAMEPQSQYQNTGQGQMSHVTGHMTGELSAGISSTELPVLEATRNDLETINYAQAGIGQSLAVGSTNTNVSNTITMSHTVNSADISHSSRNLTTQPSVSVNNWAESKFSETTDHQSKVSDIDKEYRIIKDEIPSSDNDDFGGDTDCDDELSTFDLNNAMESANLLLTPEKPKTADKPKQPADKPKQPADKPKQLSDKPKQPSDKPKQTIDTPKQTIDKAKQLNNKPKQLEEKPQDKGTKRCRKGKGKVKEEMVEPQPLPLDTSKEQVDLDASHDTSNAENTGKRRSRRKSKPVKYVEEEKGEGQEEEKGAEPEQAPPTQKKKPIKVRKVQVVRKDGAGKSKKRQKLDHSEGGAEVSVGAGMGRSEVAIGAGMGRSDVSVGEKMEDKGKPRRNPQELDEGSLKLGRPKSNKVYKCAECDYSSARRTRWTEHMGRVHGIITEKDLQRQKQPDFPCNLCDKSFIFEKDLKRHNRIVHTAVSQTCEVCNKTYKSKYVFDKHMATHKEGYVQPMFTCQLCPRSFTTKFMLAHHIKSEHLGLKKTYLCPTCGKSFSQIRSYRQHANVHAGIRPFQCETCGKSFTYEKSLKEHRYMHDNLRRFACKTCGKAFRQYTCLIIHQKTHKDTKDHICSSCGKGFTQKQSLIRHERIHTGDKPYTCSICRKAFSDYAVIRKHMMMCHKKDRDHWKDDIITDVRRPLSSHYITGGPGYVPRETSTKISDYVKPSDATLVNTDNLEPGQPMPHVPGQILPVTVPTTESVQSTSEVPEDIIKTNDELFKKVNITDEDAQNALSRLSAVYSGSNLYTATPSLGQAQDIALLPDIKVQPNSSQEQNQPSQITLLPINYSLSPNYATAVSAARTIDHPLSEEAIANYLKAEVCPKQQPKDYTTVLAPLASLVPVSETQPQKGQGQVTLATPTSGDSILSQAALSAWGYTGYPGYYTPAGFIQYQGQQPQN